MDLTKYVKEAPERIKKDLEKKGITVYFINFEIDGGCPYFVFAFRKEDAESGKKNYEKNRIPAGVFDDYAMETDKDPTEEIKQIIERRYQTWRNRNGN